jgi:hypothetical protein
VESNVVGRLARNPAAMVPKFGYAVDCQELSKLSARKLGADTKVLRQYGTGGSLEEFIVGNRLAASSCHRSRRRLTER